MLKGAAIATIALFLILSGSACKEVPAYTDPKTPAQPTSTATLISTPIEEPTETQEPTKTPTSQPTKIPTKEELYSPAAYSLEEAMKKYGYKIVGCELWNSEKMANESGLAILAKFVFKGYEVTDKGLLLTVTKNFKNKEYPLEILVDPQESYVVINAVHFLGDKEAVERWFRVGKTYHFIAFVMNHDDTLISTSSYADNNNEEWKEMRSNIDEILTQGGSTPEFYLMLNYAKLIRD